jgi:hypothetical protein
LVTRCVLATLVAMHAFVLQNGPGEIRNLHLLSINISAFGRALENFLI